MTYKHYKRLKALGFPVQNFSILDIFRKKPEEPVKPKTKKISNNYNLIITQDNKNTNYQITDKSNNVVLSATVKTKEEPKYTKFFSDFQKNIDRAAKMIKDGFLEDIKKLQDTYDHYYVANKAHDYVVDNLKIDFDNIKFDKDKIILHCKNEFFEDESAIYLDNRISGESKYPMDFKDMLYEHFFPKPQKIKISGVKPLKNTRFFNDLEEYYGVKIPDKIRKIIAKYNGGKFSTNGVISEVDKFVFSLNSDFCDFNKSINHEIYEADDYGDTVYILPFASSDIGDIGFNLTSGDIVEYDREFGDVNFIASSFEIFLEHGCMS